eukprot:m.351172 g.351172  ORF g.351172 m.351172 type:complete len:199 (+) comp55907_c0_seq12:716-1312(+)
MTKQTLTSSGSSSCIVQVAVGTTLSGCIGQWIQALNDDSSNQTRTQARHTLQSSFWWLTWEAEFCMWCWLACGISDGCAPETPHTTPPVCGPSFLSNRLHRRDGSGVVHEYSPRQILAALGDITCFVWASGPQIQAAAIESMQWITIATIVLPPSVVLVQIFNTVAGLLYDRHIDPITKLCVGMHCYRDVWFMPAGEG